MVLPEPAPDEAIRDLARCLLAGSVVWACPFEAKGHVPPDLLTQVFVPVGMNARTLFNGFGYEDFAAVTVFAIKGQHATMSDTGVYGWPQFAECLVWRMEDFAAAIEQAKLILMDVVGGADLGGRGARRRRRQKAARR